MIGGRPIQVIGLDDLIRIKRHISRPKDRESLLQLEARRARG
jgi:predicted nucleotidyltransferase